jgi:site-specific recombinase XerD
MTIDTLYTPHLQQFIDHLHSRSYSPPTLSAYSSDLVKFYKHLGPDQMITSVQPQMIEGYFQKLTHDGAKYSTLRRYLTVIRKYFIFLHSQGFINSNPSLYLKLTPVFHDILSSDDICSIFRFIAGQQHSNNEIVELRYRRDEIILIFMIFYGIRQYQIPQLKLSDIKHGGEGITLKVNQRFSINLNGSILHKLRSYLSRRSSYADVIFHEPLTSKSLTCASINTLLKELNYYLNLHCTPMILYHTYRELKNHPDGMHQLLFQITRIHSPVDSNSSFTGVGVHA